MKEEKKTFSSYGGGFHITFKNGVTLSTQYSVGNYCENRGGLGDDFGRDKVFNSNNCEIAIWDKEGEFLTKKILPDNGDDVKGWVELEEWFEILQKCKEYKE